MNTRTETLPSSIQDRLAILEARVAELEVLVAAHPRRVYMQDIIRWRLVKAMPELKAKHPDGVTTEIVADHFGFPVATTVLAIADLVKKRKLKRVRVVAAHRSILLLPDDAAPEHSPLTKQRTKVLAAMVEMSKNGNLCVPLRQLSLHLSMHPSTVNYIITCLIEARKVVVISRAKIGRPNTYFIPSAIV